MNFLKKTLFLFLLLNIQGVVIFSVASSSGIQLDNKASVLDMLYTIRSLNVDDPYLAYQKFIDIVLTWSKNVIDVIEKVNLGEEDKRAIKDTLTNVILGLIRQVQTKDKVDALLSIYKRISNVLGLPADFE